MSLHYIIDGYNVIKHPRFAATHKRTKDSRLELLEFIRRERLGGSPKNKITVVFDGYSDIRDLSLKGTEEVIFTKEETADEKIKRMVQASGNPKNIIAVSDDREIKFFVKSAGGRAISVEEFINRKQKLKTEARDLLKAELNYSQIHRINQELKKLWLE